MKTINLSGEVGYEITDRLVSSLLAKFAGEDVIISINSYGGDCFEGFAIYNTIKQYSGSTTTVIKGVAASAAGIIFLAGDKRAAYKNSTFQSHPAWGLAIGEGEILKSRGEMLIDITGLIADDLAGFMNKPKDETLAAMKKEIWLVGGDAIKSAGLADTVIDSDDEEKPETQSQAAAKVLSLIDRMKTDAQARQSELIHQQVAASISHLIRTPEPNYPVDVQNAVTAERTKAAEILTLYGCPKHVVDEFQSGADIQALTVSEVVRARLSMQGVNNELENGLTARNQIPGDSKVNEAKAEADRWDSLYPKKEAK